MKRASGVVCLAILLAGAASVPCWAESVVIVAEDGGFGVTTVNTVRSIAASELRKSGIAVTETARFDGRGRVGPELRQALSEAGVERLFVLRLGRLDEKVPFALEELDVESLAPVFVATLTAASIDEADTVLERLVASVLKREPVERGARVATVTAKEAQAFNKKPGEGLWMVGFGLEPLGFSLGWSYEARDWRLGVTLQGAEDDVSFFGIEGAWIPHDGELSPYVGGGLGIVGSESWGDDVLGAKVEVGVEMFRLHGVRLLAGVNAVIPFERKGGSDTINPGVHLKLGF